MQEGLDVCSITRQFCNLNIRCGYRENNNAMIN